jgi:hypothetical protein
MSEPRAVVVGNAFDTQSFSAATADCNKRREFTLPRKHCGPNRPLTRFPGSAHVKRRDAPGLTTDSRMGGRFQKYHESARLPALACGASTNQWRKAMSEHAHLSRRKLVAGAAALPALAVPALASAVPDPIFAAIKRHRQLGIATAAAWKLKSEFEQSGISRGRSVKPLATESKLLASDDKSERVNSCTRARSFWSGSLVGATDAESRAVCVRRRNRPRAGFSSSVSRHLDSALRACACPNPAAVTKLE